MIALLAFLVSRSNCAAALAPSTAASTTSRLSSALQSFVEGSSVRIAETRDGLGLVAKKNVRRGDVVLEVPQSSCITGDSARLKHEKLSSLEEEPMCGDLTLIAYDLMSRDWPAGYFPRSLDDSMPLFVSSPPTCSSRDFSVLRENAVDDFEALGLDDLDAFLRAVGLALSRSFAVDGELVFAPGIDFLNHDDMLDTEEECLSWRKTGPFSAKKDGGRALRLSATTDFDEGEEIRVSYGPLGAAEYLETYGFVPQRGPARRLSAVSELCFEMVGDFLEDKQRILSDNSFLQEGDQFDVGVGGEVDPELLRFLRLRHLEGSDAFLLEPIFDKEIWDFLSLPISKPNEQLVLESIRNECKAVLETLSTTTAAGDDDDDDASTMSSLFDEVRSVENEALRATLEWCEVEIASLDNKEYYQERRLKDLGLDTEWSADEAQFTAGRAPGSVDW